MNNKILISRSEQLHHGLLVSLEDEENSITNIAIINGNRPDTQLPVLLSQIDQYVVFGLSHPQALTAIQEYGPQLLVTTKDLGHRLFEHGMKAAVGKIKIKNNWYSTGLSSFYNVINSTGLILDEKEAASVTLKSDENGNIGFVIELKPFKPITIAFKPFESTEKVFYLDELRTVLTIALNT